MSPKNKLSGSRRFRVVFGVTLVSKVHSVSVVATVVSLCTCGIQSPPVFVVAQLLHIGISFLVSTVSVPFQGGLLCLQYQVDSHTISCYSIIYHVLWIMDLCYLNLVGCLCFC